MADSGPFGANADVGVGFSDKALLVVSIVGFCMLSVTVYALVIARVKTREELEEEDDEQDYDEKLTRADVSKLSRAQRRARARAIMKKERRVTPAVVAPGPRAEEEGDNEQHGGEEIVAADEQQPQPVQQHQNHLSRKERQRAAKATEKENRRLFEEERRKQQLETQQQLQKQKRERERAEEQKAQEERRQRLLEKQAREEKKQEDWKTFLSCPEQTLLVDEWIDKLRQNRNVDTEKVADSFSCSADTVRKRIERLVKEGRVGGVFEGTHFIYMTDDELKTIADKILQAGPSSLSDVALICNETLSS